MKTLILAAGQGTRLQPYTLDKPKCMVPLAGKPLLHYQFEIFKLCGIDKDITVIGGYRSENLDILNANLVINPDYATTNMVHSLFCARNSMQPGEDLLICYGDIIYEVSVLQTLLQCDAPVCLAADRDWKRLWQLRMEEPLNDAETFIMDAAGYVKELGKEPVGYDQIHAQYMGIIKIRGDRVQAFIDAFDALDRGSTYGDKDFDNMFMTSFIQHLIDSGWVVKACLVSNGWLEVDTADELELYSEMYHSGRLSEYIKLA